MTNSASFKEGKSTKGETAYWWVNSLRKTIPFSIFLIGEGVRLTISPNASSK